MSGKNEIETKYALKVKWAGPACRTDAKGRVWRICGGYWLILFP